MDIYILREGQETGPYSADTAGLMLAQEAVAASDFAWHEGLPNWVPVGELLAGGEEKSQEPASPAVGKSDPATPKQKALLSFLGIALPPDLMRDQAALIVNDAMEDPKNAARLAQWNEERFRLHPDLFAADIQAKKENRAAHFLELCQSTGAEYFSGITKAHCQVLVGFLDLKFPNWDARDTDAAAHYFFPAVAEKFPQLVNKPWRGRLQYADSPRATPRSSRVSSTSPLRRTGTSAFAAVTRGVILGVVILAGLYLAYRTLRPSSVASVESSAPPAASTPSPVALTPLAAAPVAPAELPSVEPLPPIAATAPAPVESLRPEPAPAPEPAPVPMASLPPSPADPAASTPPMTAAEPPMASIAPTAPTAPMAMESTSLTTAPMAALPGAEPSAPLSPPVAATPAAPALPNLPPEANAIPPLSPSEIPPAAPALPAPKTNLILTKPVEAQLAYGKVTLPPGTPVKLVERQGAALKVSYGSSVMTVPASSTDAD